MINMEKYKDLIDEIRKLNDEATQCEVSISGSNEDTEYLEWYKNWKRKNFNNEKK